MASIPATEQKLAEARYHLGLLTARLTNYDSNSADYFRRGS
jgi:hypothetical protein